MIKVDFAWAVGICFILAVLVFFGEGLLFRRKGPDGEKKAEHVSQCPYCGHVSVNREISKMRVCPLCKSYLEENGP